MGKVHIIFEIKYYILYFGRCMHEFIIITRVVIDSHGLHERQSVSNFRDSIRTVNYTVGNQSISCGGVKTQSGIRHSLNRVRVGSRDSYTITIIIILLAIVVRNFHAINSRRHRQ